MNHIGPIIIGGASQLPRHIRGFTSRRFISGTGSRVYPTHAGFHRLNRPLAHRRSRLPRTSRSLHPSLDHNPLYAQPPPPDLVNTSAPFPLPKSLTTHALV